MTGTFLSRLLGFARDAAIAWLLGGTGAADALTTALRIPWIARRMLGEGTLSLPLVASLVHDQNHEYPDGNAGPCRFPPAPDTRLISTVQCCALLSGIAISGLGVLGAYLVVPLLAPGLADSPQLLQQAVLLFQICLPYLLFALLAAVAMAELHSRAHFLIPSLSPSLFNMTMLAAAACAVFCPGNLTGIVLATGVLLGGCVQWLLLSTAARRLRKKPQTQPLLPNSHRSFFSPNVPENSNESPHASPCAAPPIPCAGTSKIPFISSHAWQVLGRIPAGIFGAAVPQIAFLIASGLTSFLPDGHMASLFYAERLLEFPLGVLGAAVGMTAAPQMAKLGANLGKQMDKNSVTTPEQGHDITLFVRTTKDAQLLSLALSLPAAAGLAAVAVPLVSLVLGHGAFDQSSVAATSLALCAYAPGLPAYALSRPLLAACQGLKEPSRPNSRPQGEWSPAWAGLCALLVSLICGSLLLFAVGPWGPPLGVSLGLWCQAILLRCWLKRRIRQTLAIPVRSLCTILAGSAGVLLAAGTVVRICEGMSSLSTLVLAIPAGVLVYATVIFVGDRTLLPGHRFTKEA